MAKGNTPEDLSAIYVRDQLFDIDVLGVNFQVKEITGEDYMDVVEAAAQGDGTELNRKKYINLLFRKVIVYPPELDISRMKPAALTLLISEIEDKIGVGEVARKKLDSG